MINDVQPGAVIEATFAPPRPDTLKAEVRPLIGRRARWQALWLIKEEDSSLFAGQWAWGQPTSDSLDGVPHPLAEVGLLWVPSEDLTPVGTGRYESGDGRG